LKNTEIRMRAATNGVRLWQIADELGIADGNFSRKLRHELPDSKKAKILKIIDQLAKEAKNDG